MILGQFSYLIIFAKLMMALSINNNNRWKLLLVSHH